jgi:hypothetical protein
MKILHLLHVGFSRSCRTTRFSCNNTAHILGHHQVYFTPASILPASSGTPLRTLVCTPLSVQCPVPSSLRPSISYIRASRHEPVSLSEPRCRAQGQSSQEQTGNSQQFNLDGLQGCRVMGTTRGQGVRGGEGAKARGTRRGGHQLASRPTDPPLCPSTLRARESYGCIPRRSVVLGRAHLQGEMFDMSGW